LMLAHVALSPRVLKISRNLGAAQTNSHFHTRPSRTRQET
jgi:hypothetical protein